MATILLQDSAPESYRRKLSEFGGQNMYGKPLWRIVRAEHRTHVCGGTFNEGREGGEFDFSPTGKFALSDHRIARSWTGPTEILMYPHNKGWILERWMPPYVWGERETWENAKAADGSALFGAYPCEGDYWMLSGPWPELPPFSVLEREISVYEYTRNNFSQDFEKLCQQQIADENAAAEKQYATMLDQLTAIGKEVSQVLVSGSLEAQRVRQEAYKLQGRTDHAPL